MLWPRFRQYQKRLRLERRGDRLPGPARLGLPQEVYGQLFLLLLVGFPVRCRTELLVVQLTQGADLLAAVKTLHAVYGIG